MNLLLAFLLGYLIGSFPSAFFLGKLKGQNIFKVGSGNMGAMNTARNLGYGLGILVLLLDVGKGALATYLGLKLFPDIMPALIAGVASVLGHSYSIYIGFKGGKGLATALGVSLPLYPLGGLTSLVMLLLLILILKKVNLASLMIAILYPLINTLTLVWQHATNQKLWLVVSAAGIIGLIVAMKHIPSVRKELAKN